MTAEHTNASGPHAYEFAQRMVCAVLRERRTCITCSCRRVKATCCKPARPLCTSWPAILPAGQTGHLKSRSMDVAACLCAKCCRPASTATMTCGWLDQICTGIEPMHRSGSWTSALTMTLRTEGSACSDSAPIETCRACNAQSCAMRSQKERTCAGKGSDADRPSGSEASTVVDALTAQAWAQTQKKAGRSSPRTLSHCQPERSVKFTLIWPSHDPQSRLLLALYPDRGRWS